MSLVVPGQQRGMFKDCNIFEGNGTFALSKSLYRYYFLRLSPGGAVDPLEVNKACSKCRFNDCECNKLTGLSYIFQQVLPPKGPTQSPQAHRPLLPTVELALG